jgi:dTDP-L-rhamnose 4-epimerase
VRILVTGGVGFIGTQVVDVLRAAGHDVSVLDCLLPAAHGDRRTAPAGVRVGDIRDPGVVDEVVRGVDAVVHQAAMVGMGVDLDDLPEYVSCNDLGTAVLLSAMARHGVRKLVVASSMVVYGEGGYVCRTDGAVRPSPRDVAALEAGRFEPVCPHCGLDLEPTFVPEDAPLEPRSVYAATKVAQEHLCAAWARESGSAAIALRYHNVYGPGMPRDTPYSGVAAIFRSSLERGQPARVYEDGRQLRNFVHVTDVARANLAAVTAVDDERPSGLRAYNIASSQPHTVADMASALSAAFGGPSPEVTGAFRATDVRHIMADPARARRELGFRAEVSFDGGMTEFARAPLRERVG